MEEKNNWNKPNDMVFVEAVHMLNELDKMHVQLNTGGMGVLLYYSPYYPKISAVSDALLELIMTALDLTDMGGSVATRDGMDVSMDRERFYEMLYEQRNNTIYTYDIYAAFVKRNRDAMKKLQEDYGLESKYLD